MQTIDESKVQRGDLISIKRFDGKMQLYYVTYPDGHNCFYGYRVNRDYSINLCDKRRQMPGLFPYYINDEIRIINPVPEDFREALRTLYFRVDTVLEDFGAIRHSNNRTLLRAVKFENGSYGIIQNRLHRDLSGIDNSHEYQNLLEDLSYQMLCEKWEIRKRGCDAEWLPDFFI